MHFHFKNNHAIHIVFSLKPLVFLKIQHPLENFEFIWNFSVLYESHLTSSLFEFKLFNLLFCILLLFLKFTDSLSNPALNC
ncbi:hypothetical protein CW304_09415 [Bacillus sp. UFRGS-B20]|nr:hypothetical protein CW304_09415 [Bacillus sp. UFRGS-B20]